MDSTTESRERRGRDRIALGIDALMLILLVLNLGLIMFDTVYVGSETVRGLFREHATGFATTYDLYVRKYFLEIDAVFVGIFLVEFVIRWIGSVRRGDHHRWFFFPLVHWYDLLGCVPIASMRFLRLLRLIAIGYRLHRLGVIDIRSFYIYKVIAKYANVATEEISDRVVIQVLGGVQKEVAKGTPVIERIWRDVIAPHKDDTVAAVTSTADALVADTIDRDRRALGAYTDRLIDRALHRSQHAFRPLTAVPFFGERVIDQIQDAIKVIVANVIEELLDDARRIETKQVVDIAEQRVAAALAGRDLQSLAPTLRDSIHRTLDIVKDQIQVQQWKLQELEQK